jgi:hypothetical protein
MKEFNFKATVPAVAEKTKFLVVNGLVHIHIDGSTTDGTVGSGGRY